MLVLSRKPGEQILIGEDITLTVVRIGPNTVRIGIEAPPHITIVREELATHREQQLDALFFAHAMDGPPYPISDDPDEYHDIIGPYLSGPASTPPFPVAEAALM